MNFFKLLSFNGYKFFFLINVLSSNGEAQLLFDDLQVKTPEAYCSLIKGMINVT